MEFVRNQREKILNTLQPNLISGKTYTPTKEAIEKIGIEDYE